MWCLRDENGSGVGGRVKGEGWCNGSRRVYDFMSDVVGFCYEILREHARLL